MKTFTACIVSDYCIEILSFWAENLEAADSMLRLLRPRLERDPRWNLVEGRPMVTIKQEGDA